MFRKYILFIIVTDYTKSIEMSDTTTTTFYIYANKLGYPDNLIKQAVKTVGKDAPTEDILEHLIGLHSLLCTKESSIRRRRDATYLPRYMLVQDSYYKGKEKMPFWVWVKRETIQPVTETPIPTKRRKTRTTSSSGSRCE